MRKQISTRSAAKAKKLADRVAQLEALILKADWRVGAEGKAFGRLRNGRDCRVARCGRPHG